MRSQGGMQTRFYYTFLQCLLRPAALLPRLLHHEAIKLMIAPVCDLCPLT
jgi:hypothetical protein